MRQILLLAALWGGLLPVRAVSPEAAPSDSPRDLPGYELRALERTKREIFQVGGAQVEVSVPLFVYCPIAGASPAARPLREAQAALSRLAAKPEWTADELRQVMSGLQQAARLLEVPAPPGHPVPAGKE